MKKVMHSDWWATDNMRQLEQLGLDSPFKLNGMAWRTDNGAPRPSQWQIIRKSLSHLDEAARIKVYQRFRIPTSEREEIEQARL
jgi:hypothetical protein